MKPLIVALATMRKWALGTPIAAPAAHRKEARARKCATT